MSGYAVGGFNPFLSDVDIQPATQYGNNMSDTSITSNPFLSSEVFSYESQPPVSHAENPFLSNSISTPAPAFGTGNPFADFVSPQPQLPQSFMEMEDMGTNCWAQMQTSYGSISELELQTLSSSTQDLVDTVTGALEATSDSLLNRLRCVQPSPIPQPPSPTPSPRSPSPDLLMGDEDLSSMPIFSQPTLTPQKFAENTTIDIMGLYNTSEVKPKVVECISKPFFSEVQSISLFDQDEPHLQTQLSGNILDVMMDTPINLIPILTATALPEKTQSKPEVMEIIKPAVVEVPKLETKPPERPPPARPMQPPPMQPPSAQPPPERKPLPCRPPPPVPRKDPVVQPPSPVAEPLPIFNPPQVEPTPPFGAPTFEPSPAFPLATSPFDSSQLFTNSNQFSAPTPEPIFTSPKVETAPAFTPTAQLAKDISSSFASSDAWGTAEIPKGRMPPLPPSPRPFPTSPHPVPAVPASTPATIDFASFEDRFNSIQPDAEEENETVCNAFDQKPKTTASSSVWGDVTPHFDDDSSGGFGTDDKFDEFLALREPPPVPQSTPAKSRLPSGGEDFDKQDTNLSITIRPKDKLEFNLDLLASAKLAPPPKSPAISTGSAYSEDNDGSFVPFLSSVKMVTRDDGTGVPRSDSQDSPQTPLFEEDQSQPLEDFPRIKFSGDGWEMQMRHPNKKKITGQRFWKKVYVRLALQNDIPTVQIFNSSKDKDPIQEIPLQPCYSVSDIAAQQFDQYGKIFTAKLQYVFYKERPGVRPGQITKAERITNKLSQFAAYAIQGDYQGVKEFGSDLKKLGLPLEHAPQISQLVKLGTQNFEEMKQFSVVIEEALFRLPVHRDRALTYKSEEVQVTLVDEYCVEQDVSGAVTKQIARVRLHFLSFLSGAAEVELGINDIRRQGKEVVGRHDIIPIATEEWIRIEDIELNSCVQLNVFEETKMVKFKPPDACYIELLRFRVRPPRHRELPLQVKTVFTTTGNRIEIRCDILVPGFTSRKLGQIPCEDVMVRIPIPECWIYMFRVEKHFRYGSVKSAHRRSGKVKGIERFLGAVEAVENSLMEVTSGQAKYEHQHKSIVWRVARLPKEGQGAYTTHSFFCHITLQQHEEIPENLTKHCYVEFTMPHTTISHTVCRSVSVPMCDEPPEKCVKYLSRHEYVVEIEHTQGISPATYNLAAAVVKEEPEIKAEEEPMEGKAESDSDFSDD